MKSTAIIGLGAGGHGRVIADIIARSGDYVLHAWLDQNPKLHGTTVCGSNVVGEDSMLVELYSNDVRCAFIGLGSIGDAGLRRRIAANTLEAGFSLPTITDPTALISINSDIDTGTCVFPHAIVNPECYIGRCSIINTRATVEHHCQIGEFATSPLAASSAENVLSEMVRTSESELSSKRVSPWEKMQLSVPVRLSFLM